MRSLKRIFFLAACAVIAGCASSGVNAQSIKRDPTIVVVDNQALLDMTVYVLRGSQRVRLGIATGLSKSRFTVPPGIVFGSTSLRFLADPIGSQRTPVSEEIIVIEGDEITLRIPPG